MLAQYSTPQLDPIRGSAFSGSFFFLGDEKYKHRYYTVSLLGALLDPQGLYQSFFFTNKKYTQGVNLTPNLTHTHDMSALLA